MSKRVLLFFFFINMFVYRTVNFYMSSVVSVAVRRSLCMSEVPGSMPCRVGELLYIR